MSDSVIATNEAKQRALTDFLQRGQTTILLDSRQPGVDVPDQHRQPSLILNLSYGFGGVALEISDWGVRCNLSFAGVLCPVAFPWLALYGARAIDGAVAVWEIPPVPPQLTKRRGILGLVVNAPEPDGPGAA